MSSLEHTPTPWAAHPYFKDRIVPADHVTRPIGASIHHEQNLNYYAQIVARVTDETYGRGVPGANAELIVNAVNSYEANQALIAKLVEALETLLLRDERNTCPHEDTHRGGFIWEICDGCGAKWADDEGGKPEWVDPPEWIAARAALSLAKSETPQ